MTYRGGGTDYKLLTTSDKEELMKFHKTYHNYNVVTMDTYRSGKKVCGVKVPFGYKYLVVGHIGITVDYGGDIMSAQIILGGGANFLGGGTSVISRSTSNSGGGCVMSGVITVSDTEGIVELNTYRYIDIEYRAEGRLYAIAIEKL